MDLGLSGKRVLVTGATRGIGRATAELFLKEGARVAFTARSADGVAEAQAALGDGASGSVVDSADPEAVTAWVARAAEQLGGIDAVVSNVSASGGVPLGLEGWKIQTQTDLYGAVALFDAALPHLKAAGGGSLVQVATITAIEHHDFPGNPSYGAVKAALVRLMGELAIRHGKHKVRANTVSPGPIWVDGGVWGWVKDNMPAYYERDIKGHLQGRLGTAEEVANAIVWLSSPAAGWVTGQNLKVDGGFTRGIDF
jgi:NAD(P)-dependent dehydrogenase (short-subunit alcohol dehydrogenase family)